MDELKIKELIKSNPKLGITIALGQGYTRTEIAEKLLNGDWIALSMGRSREHKSKWIEIDLLNWGICIDTYDDQSVYIDVFNNNDYINGCETNTHGKKTKSIKMMKKVLNYILNE